MKDKSNQRIVKKMEELYDFMVEEDRGFIFVPMAQMKGNHKTMCFVSFNKEVEKLNEDDMIRFWATMASLIENVQTNIPEHLKQDYKDGFLPFVGAVSGRCFPSIKLINISDKHHKK